MLKKTAINKTILVQIELSLHFLLPSHAVWTKIWQQFLWNSSSSNGGSYTRITCVECILKAALYQLDTFLASPSSNFIYESHQDTCSHVFVQSCPKAVHWNWNNSTTWGGRLFKVVAILLVNNRFLVLQSLHSSLTTCECVSYLNFPFF